VLCTIASSAILLFQKTANIEPQSVSAHVTLADAWSWLGYDDRATQEATKALELAKQVLPEMRLWGQSLADQNRDRGDSGSGGERAT
jgi:hypothetical protein